MPHWTFGGPFQSDSFILPGLVCRSAGMVPYGCRGSLGSTIRALIPWPLRLVYVWESYWMESAWGFFLDSWCPEKKLDKMHSKCGEC